MLALLADVGDVHVPELHPQLVVLIQQHLLLLRVADASSGVPATLTFTYSIGRRFFSKVIYN